MNNFVKSLADMLNLDAETLAKAVQSSEEPTIKLPDGKFHLDSDIEELKENLKKEKSKSYEEGKTAGIEITTKTFSRASGLDTIKDPDEFVKALSDKIASDAKIEPNKKVEELNISVEKLQKQLSESEQKYSELQNNLREESINNRILSKIPDSVNKFGIDKKEALIIYKTGRKITDEGVFVGDQLVKDSYERPISVEQDVESFIAKKGWLDKPEGRAGQSSGAGNLPKSFSEYEEVLKEKGLHPGSIEANELLASMAKENPEILK